MYKYAVVLGKDRAPDETTIRITLREPLHLVDKQLLATSRQFWVDHGGWTLQMREDGQCHALESNRVGPWPAHFYLESSDDSIPEDGGLE